jgi:hypothetical protein
MDKDKELGDAGEKIVHKFLKAAGHKPEMSKNKYDREKDMILENNVKIEVKTQRPWRTKEAFSVRVNQHEKCSGVDWVYFVSVHHNTQYHPSSGNIYRLSGEEFDKICFQGIPSDGRDMRLVRIADCELVGRVTDEEYELLREIANR